MSPCGAIPVGAVRGPGGTSGGRVVAERAASRPSTSSCRRPLVHTTLPPSGVALPVRSVNVPPASSTMTCSAARSQSETSGSADTSTAPSATSMCDQKSPYARVRQTERVRLRKPSSRPWRSQPDKLRVGQRGVRQAGHLGDPAGRGLGQAPARPGAAVPRRPPPAAERGRGDHPDRRPRRRPSARSASPRPARRGRSSRSRRSGRAPSTAGPRPIRPDSSPSTASRGLARPSTCRS